MLGFLTSTHAVSIDASIANAILSKDTVLSGEIFQIDLSVVNVDLSQNSEIKEVFLKEVSSSSKIYASNFTALTSLDAELTLFSPDYLRLHEFQNWELVVDFTSSGPQSWPLNLFVNHQGTQPHPISVRRTSPQGSYIVDTGFVSQTFIVEFDQPVTSYNNWTLSLSSNGISKRALSNVQIIGSNIIQGDLPDISLVGEFPSLFINNDQMNEMIIPRVFQKNSNFNPVLVDLTLNGQRFQKLEWGKTYQVEATFKNVDFFNNPVNFINFSNSLNQLTSRNIQIIDSDRISFEVNSEGANASGYYHLELGTQNWFKGFQSLVYLYKFPELVPNAIDLEYDQSQGNDVGFKFENIDLTEVDITQWDAQLYDGDSNIYFVNDFLVISSDSLNLKLGEMPYLRYGKGKIELNSHLMPLGRNEQGLLIRSSMPPVMDQISFNSDINALQITFSDDVSNFNDSIYLVFDTPKIQDTSAFSMNRITSSGLPLKYEMLLTQTEAQSLIDLYSHSGSLPQWLFKEGSFQSTNTSLPTDGKDFIDYNHVKFLDGGNLPFKLARDVISEVDLQNNTLRIDFGTSSLTSITTDNTQSIRLIVHEMDGVDTIKVNNLQSRSSFLNNSLLVDISDLTNSIESLVSQQNFLELQIDESIVFNAEGKSNIFTARSNQNPEVFGAEYAEWRIINGPLWFQYSHLDFQNNSFRIEFNGPINPSFSTGKTVSIDFFQLNGSIQTESLEIQSAQSWDAQVQNNFIEGALTDSLKSVLLGHLNHGVQLRLNVDDSVFQSDNNSSYYSEVSQGLEGVYVSFSTNKPWVQNAFLHQQNSLLDIQFSGFVSDELNISQNSVNIVAYRSSTDTVHIAIDSSNSLINSYGDRIEFQLNTSVIQSLGDLDAAGYFQFYLTVDSSIVQGTSGEFNESLTYDDSFVIDKPLPSEGGVVDFKLLHYNLVNNQLEFVTNTILDSNMRFNRSVDFNFRSELNPVNRRFNFVPEVNFYPLKPNHFSITLPDSVADKIENQYGFLTKTFVEVTGDLVSSEKGFIYNRLDESKLLLPERFRSSRTLEMSQFNLSTNELTLLVEGTHSDFNDLTLGVGKNIPGANSSELLVVNQPIEVSQVKEDGEYIFDLSEYRTELLSLIQSSNDLYVYVDSSENNEAVLGNVIVSSGQLDVGVDAIEYINQRITISFQGQLTPNFDKSNLGLVHFDSLNHPVFSEMNMIPHSQIIQSNNIQFLLTEDPRVTLQLPSNQRIFFYFGASNLIQNQTQGFEWNQSNLTQILGPAADEVEAPIVKIDFINETTLDIVPDSVVFSQSRDFVDSTIGLNQRVKLVPGTRLYFKYINTPGEIFELQIPVRPSLNFVNNSVELQVFQKDSNYLWRTLADTAWSKGDGSWEYLEERGSIFQYQLPASEFSFKSLIGVLSFNSDLPYFNPTLRTMGTAYMIDWAPSLESNQLGEFSYRYEIKGPSIDTVISGSQSFNFHKGLSSGAYNLNYELITLDGELVSNGQRTFEIQENVQFPILEGNDISNWRMLGVGDTSSSINSRFSQAASIYHWKDDEPLDALYGKYIEVEPTTNLSPADGFWLYSTSSEPVEFLPLPDSIETVQINPIVGEDGWQQVTNPWSFPIDLRSIRSEGRILELWKWNPEASDFVLETEFIEPGIGYYTQVSTTATIEVDQIPYINRLTMTPIAAAPMERGPGNWTLDLGLFINGYADQNNQIGITTSQPKIKKDFPNSLVKKVSLSIDDHQRVHLQSSGEDSYQWEVNLSQSMSGTTHGVLKVEGLERAEAEGFHVFYYHQNEWNELNDSNRVRFEQNQEKILLQATLNASPSLNQGLKAIQLEIKKNVVRSELNATVTGTMLDLGYDWQILDSKGQLIFEKNGETRANLEINLAGEVGLKEQGIYFLQVRSGTQSQGQRFVLISQ